MCKIMSCRYSLQHCEAIERGKKTNYPASPVDENIELFFLKFPNARKAQVGQQQ